MKKIFRKAIASITLCGMLLSMSESSLVPFSSTYLAEDITADDGIVADDDALPVNSSVQEDKASGTRQDLTGAGLIEGEERDTQGGASSGSQAGEQNARTELQADVKDMDLHTEVSGAVPADAYLTAEQFTGTAAMEGLELLQAVKLEVMNADGTAYTQDADYEISITSSQIRDALSAGRTLSVYRAKRDGSSEQKREDLKVVEENGVKVLRFTNDKIDERPVFLIMEDALQQNTPESQTPQTEAVTQAQESETQAPQTETQVQESETQAPQSETQVKESETQAPQTETQVQESETQAPQTETQIQESETQAPAVAPQTLTAAPKTGESESETEAVSETESEPQSEAVSETETESELQSETESEAKLILTAQTLKGTIYSDETYTTLADSDKTIITVKGSLPENAVVLAYPVNVTLEGKTVLAAYDITIYTVDAEGNRTKYQPGEENPVEVTIESPAIQAANEEIQQSGNETQEVASDSSVVTGADDGQTITTGKEIGVYHIEDDKTGEPVEVKQSSEDTQPGEVKFGASSFSVYVVATEDILQQLSFTDKTIEAAIYTDDTYTAKSQDTSKISISGNMPENVEARAYPVDVSIEGKNILVSYDIKMLIPTDNSSYALEYQPGETNPVSVKISSEAIKEALQENSENNAELAVLHMETVNDADYEQVPLTDQGSEDVSFKAESFSIYIVTGETSHTSDNKISLSNTFIALETGASAIVKANESASYDETFTWKITEGTNLISLSDSTNGEDGADSSAKITAGNTAGTATVLVTSTYSVQETTYYYQRLSRYDNLKTGYYTEEEYNYYRYHTYSHPGTWTVNTTSSQKSSSTTLTVAVLAPSTNSSGDLVGNITHTKKVTKRDGEYTADGDQIYDLSLTITGTSQNFQEHEDIDVVFVVDCSNSMNEVVNEKEDRISSAKAAISSFEATAKELSLNARYSLVTFSGTDYRDSAYNDATIQHGWSGSTDVSKIASVEDSYNGYTCYNDGNGGGTNYQAGLMLADNLLRNDHTTAKKVVVFLTDGNCGFYYNDNGLTAGEGSPATYNEKSYEHATDTVKNLPLSGDDYFFAIGCGTAQAKVMSGIADAAKTKTSKAVYKTTANAADLKTIFSDIVKGTSTVSCQNVEIRDELSDNVQIYKPSSASLTDLVKVVAIDKDGNNSDVSTNWTIAVNGSVVTAKLKSGSLDPSKTYELTYPIIASAAAKEKFITDKSYPNTADKDTGTYSGKTGYYTNVKDKGTDTSTAHSSGSFVYYEEAYENGTSTGRKYSLPYAMPVIPVFTLTLSKVITGLSEAELDSLTQNLQFQITSNTSSWTRTIKYSELTVSTDGSYSITIPLPAADTTNYTVKEVNADVSGKTLICNQADETGTVSVNHDYPNGNIAFVNTYDTSLSDKEGQLFITGQKIWNDGENNQNSRPDSIKVLLYSDIGEAQPVREATASAQTNWTYKFDISNLPLVNPSTNKPVKYWVIEQTAEGKEIQTIGYYQTAVQNPQITFTYPDVSSEWTKRAPNNNLSITNNASGKTVVVANKGSVWYVWTVDPLTPSERSLIQSSVESSLNGKVNEIHFFSGEGSSAAGMTVTKEYVSFTNPSNWSLLYWGLYNRGTEDATSSSIQNTLIRTLTVGKTVAGNMGDTTKSFTFNVKLGNLSQDTSEKSHQIEIINDINKSSGITFDANGVCSFLLKDTESKEINLLYGTTYSVTEDGAVSGDNRNAEGYCTSYKKYKTGDKVAAVRAEKKSYDSSSYQLTEQTTQWYTNERTAVAPTELPMLRWRYVMMVAASVLGLAAVFVVFRRRRRLDN